MTDTLPNKMSDLLEIAINDARKLEALPGFKLEMKDWLVLKPAVGGGQFCEVCLAGAVIHERLAVKPKANLPYRAEPRNLDKGTEYKLYAIDDMRVGMFTWAADYLKIERSAEQTAALVDIGNELSEQVDDDYDHNTDQEGTGLAPWEAYEKAINQLREIGL